MSKAKVSYGKFRNAILRWHRMASNKPCPERFIKKEYQKYLKSPYSSVARWVDATTKNRGGDC